MRRQQLWLITAIGATLFILLVCVLWGVVADIAVTRYCDLPPDERPSQVGYLECDLVDLLRTDLR